MVKSDLGKSPNWFGYIHVDGSIKLKKFFTELEIEEALASPFVKEAFGPWHCDSRQEAAEKMANELRASKV